MGSIYDILQQPSELKTRQYISSISKSMDIENCKSMINTFLPNTNFTTVNKLIAYCEEEKIPYFKRGEYDVFTLAEIESIIVDLNTQRTLEIVYKNFKSKYPKRLTDMSLKQFEDKLTKLDLIKEGEELNSYMRFTNDVVEYVRKLGKEHTLKESLKLVQDEYPSLNMDLNKLNEMQNRYLIKFVENDTRFFNAKQVEDIKMLSQSCDSIKELFNIFIGMHPEKKCDYFTFIQELSKLKVMSDFPISGQSFTVLEEAYLDELLKSNEDNASLFAMFNKVFPNKYPYMQFVTKLNELKVAKALKKPKNNNWAEARKNPKITALVDYVKNEKDLHTINEWVEIVNKDDRFDNYTYKGLHNLFTRYDLPYSKEAVRGKIKEVSEADIELIRKYAEQGLTLAKIKEAVDKETDTFKDIAEPTFRLRVKEYGIELKAKRGKYDRNGLTNENKPVIKKGGRKGLYTDIYNDVVVTVEGSTLPDALAQLKEKHPDLADRMTEQNLRQFAMRHDMNYIKQMPNRSHSKNSKGAPRSEETDKIYERLKELAKDYTKKECVTIINKEFNKNYTDTYVYDICRHRGELKFKIYEHFTDEMKDMLRPLLSSGLNKREIFKEFCKVYPHTFTVAMFHKCLGVLELENGKIVIHSTDGSKPKIELVQKEPVQETSKSKVVEWHKEPEIEIDEDDFVELNLQEQEDFVEPIQQNTDPMAKYQPIIDEVNETFEKKCRQLHKTGDTHDHTDELINALDILVKYATNRKQLVNLANDHEDILEQYRREVEHEIEIEPWTDNPYCQNKEKAIAMRRREIKYTRDTLNVMSNLLKHIADNKEIFENTLEDLKAKKVERANATFVPLVDANMVKRLKWCRSAGWGSKKAYTPILVTNARIERINKAKAQSDKSVWTEKEITTGTKGALVKQLDKEAHRISTYRVKAEFLVLKGNPFVNKYYDVEATSEEKALEKAKEYFDIISSSNENAQYKIDDIHRLNN